MAAWLLTVPWLLTEPGCWLLASAGLAPDLLVREGPLGSEAPGDRGRTASAETGPGQ